MYRQRTAQHFPPASCYHTKLDGSAKYVKDGPCGWLCERVCQLLLGIDIFDSDVALLNLPMKPIILGEEMAVLIS